MGGTTDTDHLCGHIDNAGYISHSIDLLTAKGDTYAFWYRPHPERFQFHDDKDQEFFTPEPEDLPIYGAQYMCEGQLFNIHADAVNSEPPLETTDELFSDSPMAGMGDLMKFNEEEDESGLMDYEVSPGEVAMATTEREIEADDDRKEKEKIIADMTKTRTATAAHHKVHTQQETLRAQAGACETVVTKLIQMRTDMENVEQLMKTLNVTAQISEANAPSVTLPFRSASKKLKTAATLPSSLSRRSKRKRISPDRYAKPASLTDLHQLQRADGHEPDNEQEGFVKDEPGAEAGTLSEEERDDEEEEADVSTDEESEENTSQVGDFDTDSEGRYDSEPAAKEEEGDEEDSESADYDKLD